MVRQANILDHEIGNYYSNDFPLFGVAFSKHLSQITSLIYDKVCFLSSVSIISGDASPEISGQLIRISNITLDNTTDHQIGRGKFDEES